MKIFFALLRITCLNSKIELFLQVMLDIIYKLQEREIKGILKYPVYEIMHHHVWCELLSYIWFLDFDCYVPSIFQLGFVNLRQRSWCHRLEVERLKWFLYGPSHIFFENFNDFFILTSFGLVLKFTHMLIEGRREDVIHRGDSLSKFDVQSIIVDASYVFSNLLS